MLKSVAVVIGSYILSVVLVFATNPLLSRMFPGEFEPGQVPSNAALISSTVLFALISILCAFVCARLAPPRAARHVLWFFILGEAMGVAFTIPNWRTGWPHWYWISWLLIWPVACYLGLIISGRQADRRLSPASS